MVGARTQSCTGTKFPSGVFETPASAISPYGHFCYSFVFAIIICNSMAKFRKWTDDQLIEAIKTTTSLRQTLLKLGLCGRGGGSYSTIQQHIKKMNLNTSHWTGQVWNKNRKSPSSRRRPLEDFLVENSLPLDSKTKKRLRQANILGSTCQACGLGDWWNGKPIQLQIDHINGVRGDHKIENLRLLCPNCHSQTATFAGRSLAGRKIVIKNCKMCQTQIPSSRKMCQPCFQRSQYKKIKP